MALLHTVEEMTKVIRVAPKYGIEISKDLLSYFSPYRKGHIIRLGKYEMNIDDIENSDNLGWSFGIGSEALQKDVI